MKTLLSSIILLFVFSKTTAQKYIYLENQKDFDIAMVKRDSPNELEEIKTIKMKNQARFQKNMNIVLKKCKELTRVKEDVVFNYRVFVNKMNTIDSIQYYFTEFKMTRVDSVIKGVKSNYFGIEDPLKLVEASRSIKAMIENTSLYENPMKPYEIRGSFLLNQYFSKSDGWEGRLKTYLAEKQDTVKTLKLAGLGLKGVTKDIYRFKNLETLDLSKNEIESLSIDLKKLPKLKKLTISDNMLSEKTLKLNRNKSLNIINLTNNNFNKFPSKLYRSKNLKDLHLASNFISDFGKTKLKKFSNLELLNLYNNQFSVLPEKIVVLKNLQILDLYHNNLKFLPSNIDKFQNLQTLAISNNDLWELPANLKNLVNLKVIYVHHNKLSAINALPPNIEYLDLGFNLLTEVPKSLNNLEKLTHLDLANNKMISGSEVLKQIPNLKNLNVIRNDFESDPTKFAELQQIIVDLEKKSVKVK